MKKIFIIIFIIGLIITFFSFKDKETKIIFVGDLFFDRHIRRAMYQNGEDYIFACLGDFFKKADLVVGNLEGPITPNASVSLVSRVGAPENFTFTFPTNTAKLLNKNNIKIVSLGNNHIGNFGKSGIESTKKYLSEAGVEYFGGLQGDESILRKEVSGNKLTFIAYNEFGGENAKSVAEKIKTEREAGQKVIVFAHWGEEYTTPPRRVKETAKLFAESGAFLIIGAHPHVIQESENLISPQSSLYPKERVTPVYYSLGNFIFDQYWNKEVSTGLALVTKIKGDKIEIEEQRVSIQKTGQTCLEK